MDIPATKIEKSGFKKLLSWGSILGSCQRAFEELSETEFKIDHAHIHHLSPLPADLGDIFSSYEKIYVAEQNMVNF